MKRLIILTALLFFFFTTLTCQADLGGHLFKVNLIVFLQNNQKTKTAEDWTNQLIIPYAKNTLTLKPAAINQPQANNPVAATGYNPYQYNGSAIYTLLSSKQFEVKSTVKKLNRDGYTILLNTAWVQPAVQTNRWLHIFGGQAYDAQGNPLPTPIQPNSTPTQTNAKYWQVNGMIRVSYNRFFNVGLHLYLTEPTKLGSNVNSQQFGFVSLRTFHLFNFQRARPGQMIYFDHPLFGAIILIRPYKQS